MPCSYDFVTQSVGLRSPTKLPWQHRPLLVGSFILKGGFRDGLAGLSIAGFAAHHAFLKHLMLWEKQKAEGRRQ